MTRPLLGSMKLTPLCWSGNDRWDQEMNHFRFKNWLFQRRLCFKPVGRSNQLILQVIFYSGVNQKNITVRSWITADNTYIHWVIPTHQKHKTFQFSWKYWRPDTQPTRSTRSARWSFSAKIYLNFQFTLQVWPTILSWAWISSNTGDLASWA